MVESLQPAEGHGPSLTGGVFSNAGDFEDWLTTTVAGNGPYIIKIPELKTGLQKGNTAAKVIGSDPAVVGDVDSGTIGWLTPTCPSSIRTRWAAPRRCTSKRTISRPTS